MLPGQTISRIKDDDIDVILNHESGHVLLGCIRQDDNFEDRLRALEVVSQAFGNAIEVFFVLDDLIPFFMEQFEFEGTPTFVLLSNGKSIGCILGNTSTKELVDFVNRGINQVSRNVDE